MDKIKILPLTKTKLNEAVKLVLAAELDTREEIEHHLEHINAHYMALDGEKVVGVIGWYQDNVKYATEAMGDKFPGEKTYWVGFFAVSEKYRGKAVGYALLKILEEVVKAKGTDELWVVSVPQTRFYYLRQGFKLVMEGYISGNKKYFMVKDLNISN
ncbi:hypothetical protein A3D05_00200 [Candidatus Gottesmanbacteria bacterium RIFCSPHIGHO2_02_FULL_40_24]|uniref:N-acetyltransferase domain-containing protein n=1 Tax=Candidatus Gottesmanbacteria bacterium RIFCSPHIGHO2_01_FULL_40_15 TaxID=1798376 RepID=A0A1F5Z712_9BACT|nr:MAG: hypothetical protein A2777_00205 [Candidatus Gottesmanbacteria bacterium RIFCSPHIGHO2_01_FULL_40_15]OGG17772.1 MAG: hypothetical protein A3D05_00200 [Candidatus Gottesmanbacteria bacterium RIFCSPHIGHO2_02_FULL_40_24]OGG21884.1 MAG: hypothetical protein A3B48_04130 [Candidatus Gottesmanbacteria bacterium RIFCSPLOWO2_01_FULL_40_10]OGG25515.1 MAG: hypothetical protein A3E42_03670 [Candidatus Gottesmanbacteria bacterium RIFCSPHIGHO2_12_FULL_40_13]OGG33174.1 MAG: hypothetical protein A3I80_0